MVVVVESIVFGILFGTAFMYIITRPLFQPIPIRPQ